MPEATLSNAITNGIHATFLLAYFVGACRVKFPPAVTGLFLLLFVLKVMGVFVHYAPESPVTVPLWGIIAVASVLMNFIVLREAGVPGKTTAGVLSICVAGTVIFLMGAEDFSYIALPTAFVFGLATRYAPPRSKLRIGLAMVAVSNLVWFAARKIGSAMFGGEVPVAYRYDNDLYHFMLIASTYLIYRGFCDRLKQPR